MLKELLFYKDNLTVEQSLNPYFNGTCSKREITSKVITARLES